MNRKMILSIIACSALLSGITTNAFASFDLLNGPDEMNEQMRGGWGMQPGGGSGAQNIVNEPGEIVMSSAANTAAGLQEDYENAVFITMSDTENRVKIEESGTYVISGSASDGNITVKKGTTGVVLVLKDLDLTGTTGAPLSINKETETKVVISGTVTLTDAEDPADENSGTAEIADAYDGAAIKVKADSMTAITGEGTLNIIGRAKNGIKGGDGSSLILDGPTIRISAVNDGINVAYDLTILEGSVEIATGDDAIHADHILTIGNENSSGPDIYISQCGEGLEASVVNIFGGDITVNAADDAINAADKDDLYEGQITPSINMTGGSVTINGQGDGFDSNGNINLIAGSAMINTQNRGGEAGIDYDGAYYVSGDFQMNNSGGVSGPDNMGGGFGKNGGFGQGGQGGRGWNR